MISSVWYPDLERAAVAALELAHAPYSGFRVGAAILDENGHIHIGTNVENSAYTGAHAEYSAVSAMIAQGGRRIVAIAIAGSSSRTTSPCGGCRQHLSEFASMDVPVILVSPGGARVVTTLDELLPMKFGASHFEKPAGV